MTQLSSRIYAIEKHFKGPENLAGKTNRNGVLITIHINALFEPTYLEGPMKDVNLEKTHNAGTTVLNQGNIYIHAKQKDQGNVAGRI